MFAKPVDLEAIYHLIRERLWLILVCEVVVVSLAVLYALRAPKIYAATAVLQVEQTEPKVIKFESVIQEDWKDAEMMKTMWDFPTMDAAGEFSRISP